MADVVSDINKPCNCKECPLKSLNALMDRLKEEGDRRYDSLFGDGIRYSIDIIKEYLS